MPLAAPGVIRSATAADAAGVNDCDATFSGSAPRPNEVAELASRTVECIEDDVVAAYVDGALTAAEVVRVETHLSACEACRKDVSALAVVQHERTTRWQL